MAKYTAAVALENRKAFQRWLAVKDDGIVGPATIAAYDGRMVNLCAAAVTDADIRRFAADLGVSAKQVSAVAKVESAGGGYDNKGRPKILFERHYFWRLTDGAYPQAAWNQPKGGGYSEDSWGKLKSACRLDPVAALSSASWGKFQIMGAHWPSLGYPSVFAMVQSIVDGEVGHYDALARFIRVNGLQDEMLAISAKPADNVPFVLKYNGPNGVQQNKYHERLASAMR